jgi:hypothetical protein
MEVNVDAPHSADVEEICSSLERAVLKYFPRQIEKADTFVFANGGDADDSQLALFPKRQLQHRLLEIRRGLSFVTRVLPECGPRDPEVEGLRGP